MKQLKKHLLAVVMIAALVCLFRVDNHAATSIDAKPLYVSTRSVTLYTDINKNSTSIAIPYRECVYAIKTVKSGVDGEWIQVYYDKKILYYFKTPELNNLVESMPEPKFEGNNPWQQQVLDNIKFILDNWDTKYAHQSSQGIMDEDGKYGFDCSGLSAFVINRAMQKFVPIYRLSTSIVTLYESDVLYNIGQTGEYHAQTVCEGVLDETKLQPGDILFFNLNTEENGEQHERGYNHCGIYIGDGEMVHSSHSFDGKVRLMPLTGIYYTKFVKARRYLPENVQKIGELQYTNKTATKIYSQKSTTSSLAAKVGIEVPVEILFGDVNNNWVYVRLSDGTQGFVLRRNLCKSIKDERITIYARDTMRLYRYLDTKRDYRLIDRGASVTLHGRVGAGDFYEVELEGEIFYIYAKDGLEKKVSTAAIF